MIKYLFAISTIVLFLYGCGYKTNPIYVDSQKENKK